MIFAPISSLPQKFIAMTSAPTTCALKDIEEAILAIIAQYNEDGEVVTAYEKICLELARSDGLLTWSSILKADWVGVHPANRAGVGLVVSKAIANAELHVDGGWSYAKACEGAVCFQAPPNNVAKEKLQRYNTEIAASQAVKIPELSQLEAVSVGASHVNCFLRLSLGNAAVTSKKLAPLGKLSPIDLGKRSNDLKKGIEEGLRWKVVHWQVAETFPTIPVIFQKYLNYRGTSETSEMEGLLTITESALAAVAANAADPWERAKRDAIVARPFWTTWTSAMADFAKSVGADQLKELSRILEVCMVVPPECTISYGRSGSAFYDAAKKLKWNGIANFPRVKLATLTANSLCPYHEMDDGLAKLIRPSDFTKLASRSMQPMVQLAEEIMDTSRVMTALLPDCARLRLIGFNDARLICHLTGQSQRFEGRRFSSLRDAAQVCMRMRVCVRVCVCVYV